MKDIHLQLPRNPEERPGWVVVVNDTPPYDINVYIVTCKECAHLKPKLQNECEENARLKGSLERLRREVSLDSSTKDKKPPREESAEVKEVEEERAEEIKINLKKTLKKFEQLMTVVNAVKNNLDTKGYVTLRKAVGVVMETGKTLLEKIGQLEYKLRLREDDNDRQQDMMREMRAEITDLQCEITDMKNSHLETSKEFRREKREALSALEETKNRHAAALYKQLKELQTQAKERDRQNSMSRERLRMQIDKLSFFSKSQRERLSSAVYSPTIESCVSALLTSTEKHLQYLSEQIRCKSETIQTLINKKNTSFSKSLMEIESGSYQTGVLQLRLFGTHDSGTWVLCHRPTKDIMTTSLPSTSLADRIKCLEKAWHAISSLAVPSEEELISTCAQFIRTNEDISMKALRRTPIYKKINNLSRAQTLDLKNFLHLSSKKVHALKRFLLQRHIAIFPPFKKLTPALNHKVDLSQNAIEIGTDMLHAIKHGCELSKVTYIKVKDVREEVKKVVTHHIASDGKIAILGKVQTELWLQVGLGGTDSFTTLSVNVANVERKVEDKLMALIQAPETYQNAKRVFSSLFKPHLQALIDMKWKLKSNPTSLSTRLFGVGDYESLCNIAGHDGPKSKSPCLWCLVGQDGFQKKAPHTPFMLNRNQSTWERYTQCMFTKREKGTTETSREMLLPLNYNQLVPPVEQLVTQMGTIIFILLHQMCRSLDQKNMEGKHMEKARFQDASLQRMVREAKEIEAELEVAKQDYKLASKALISLDKCLEREKLSSKSCCYGICIEEGAKKTEGQKCSKCGGSVHRSCAAILQTADDLNKDPYVCPECSGLCSDVIDFKIKLKEKIESHQTKLVKLTGQRDSNQSCKNSLSKTRIIGPTELLLLKLAHNRMKTEPSPFPESQQLTYKQVKLMLLHADIMTSVLSAYKIEKGVFRALLSQFASIHRLITMKRFLHPHEVKTLCHICWDLGTWFPQRFSTYSTLELHIIVFHIPEFAMKWQTIGLLGNRGTTTMVKNIKKDFKAHQDIPNVESLKLCYSRNAVRSVIPPKQIRPKKRKAPAVPDSGPVAKKQATEGGEAVAKKPVKSLSRVPTSTSSQVSGEGSQVPTKLAIYESDQAVFVPKSSGGSKSADAEGKTDEGGSETHRLIPTITMQRGPIKQKIVMAVEFIPD